MTKEDNREIVSIPLRFAVVQEFFRFQISLFDSRRNKGAYLMIFDDK